MLIDHIENSLNDLDFELGVDPYSSSEEILALQKLLMMNGYELPKYGADGDYGAECIHAVESYQKDNGLDVTGIADPATLQHMKASLGEITNDLNIAETQLRSQVLQSAESFVGTVETDGDNNSPMIAQFLRSNKFDAEVRADTTASAPLGSAWCAGFASHVLSGVSPHIANYDVLAKGIMRQFDKNGAFYDMDSGYSPQPGDMIFFDRGDTGDWRGHVGFIKEVRDDGTIVAIEGNKHHPDFADEDSYAYDPERPDGVRIVEYSPEEFADERMLGFGNTMEMYATKVGFDHAIRASAEQSTPQFTPAPDNSQTAPVLNAPEF